MIDLERWYKRCLIQLDIMPDSEQGAMTKDIICCFAEDPKWLEHCLTVVEDLDILLKTKQEVILLTTQQAEHRDLLGTDIEFPKKLSNGNIIDRQGSAYYEIRQITLPLPPKENPLITQGQLLPDWFLNFYSGDIVKRLFSVESYITFKTVGDIGWLSIDETPEELLTELVDKYGLVLGDQENSKSRRELLLTILKFLMEAKTLDSHVPRSLYAHLHVSDSKGSNAASELRKALRERQFNLPA